MIKIFRCESGFYAVTFYDVQYKTWLVYWSGSKDLNKAMLAAVECQQFIGDPNAVILMTN